MPTDALTKEELQKMADPTLGGTIGETMAQPEVDRFSVDDEKFIKFHGIYQQDDRDLRKTGKTYIMMIRARITGGIVSAEQYLALDDLATRHANDTLRITSRQTFQWHGVMKTGLGPLMKGLNEALITTIAACGDVNRNVLAPSTPSTSPLADLVQADALRVSDALLPQTKAYHEIWVNGGPLKLTPDQKLAFEDPLYRRNYLPRKFKIAFAIPPLNDTDIFANCLGFAAIADPANPARLLGYNVLCGGGLGMSHGNEATFPRAADVLGFIPADRVVETAKAVMIAFRDHGDRTNRKHARLKYVLAEKGPAWFRAEVEERAGFKLEPARAAVFTKQGDRFGWHRQSDGRWFLGMYVETGRIKDTPERRLKTALRSVVAEFRPEVRLTTSQNLILAGIPEEQREAINRRLAEHGVPVDRQVAAVRLNSMACVAMPTCGLALAESERVFPQLLDRLEALFTELALGDEDIVVRMTGCPNGCARPYMAEIGLVGRAPGKYNLHLGGVFAATRINRVYREGVKFDDIIAELRPLLARWKQERLPGERFGEFVDRAVPPPEVPPAKSAA
jgi:sulfite reductase (NADPH) hemoprotein beta-component